MRYPPNGVGDSSPEERLQRELPRITDWYTDELFDAGAEASRLIFPVSRLVCDPEHFADDANEPMAAKGMGVSVKWDWDTGLGGPDRHRPPWAGPRRQV